jgi:RloB-like protein
LSKRRDKNRKQAAYERENEAPEKSVLLLVEGKTEKVYFDGLKQNQWLKNALSGIMVEAINKGKGEDNDGKKEQGENMDTLIENYKKLYEKIWIVWDNDKRSAFTLSSKKNKHSETRTPFWKKSCNLPQEIIDKLSAAYIDDSHRYFLSIYDYLQWLKTAIGADNVVQYWDTIQHLTSKHEQLKKFENDLKKEDYKHLQLAYSCIAFEFWLLLHFEQNKTPFLWVDKDKNEDIDVFTALQKIIPDYGKGDTKPCNAYTCLYDDYKKQQQTIDDDWSVIYRIITACVNAKWLQNKMKPILERQNDKWYEVNPYILGLDTLLETLLNLHYCNQEIEYQDATISFEFDAANKRVGIKVISTQKPFSISEENMKIKAAKQDFLPNKNATYDFPNDAKTRYFYYEALPTYEKLVLIFKINSFQKQLLVVLSEV